MPVQAKPDPEKTCKACGKAFTRRRFGKRLEDRTRFLSREHCSQSCANTKPVIQVDSHRWIARQVMPRKSCIECGVRSKLHVHHKDRNPANNTPANLVVLCKSCHMKLHWREDREIRIGARMGQPYALGKSALVAKPRNQLSPIRRASRG